LYTPVEQDLVIGGYIGLEAVKWCHVKDLSENMLILFKKESVADKDIKEDNDSEKQNGKEAEGIAG